MFKSSGLSSGFEIAASCYEATPAMKVCHKMAEDNCVGGLVKQTLPCTLFGMAGLKILH